MAYTKAKIMATRAIIVTRYGQFLGLAKGVP